MKGLAHLERANLEEAYLEDTELRLAHLERATLQFAHLERADLWLASLEGVKLWESSIDNDTNLRDAHWGNYILGEETEREFGPAINTYRRLKQWHTNAGMYDVAGEFFFREMTVKRKAMEWWPKPWNRAFSKLLSILCGYGERPERVGISAAVVVLGLALIYFTIGTLTRNTFLDSLYYSAVSFIALGYGQWAPQPAGWVKGLGVFEAFIGVFMMALFLVTFTRKMIR